MTNRKDYSVTNRKDYSVTNRKDYSVTNRRVSNIRLGWEHTHTDIARKVLTRRGNSMKQVLHSWKTIKAASLSLSLPPPPPPLFFSLSVVPLFLVLFHKPECKQLWLLYIFVFSFLFSFVCLVFISVWLCMYLCVAQSFFLCADLYDI